MIDCDALLHWAMIQHELQDSQDEILSRHGFTWKTLRDLEHSAVSQMTDDVIETEFGNVVAVKKHLLVSEGITNKYETIRLKLVR